MRLGTPRPEPVGPDQESVWDYPRPPALEVSGEQVMVTFAGELVAASKRAIRVLETSHAPVYYIPREDVRTEFLRPVELTTSCEFKGRARYADLVVGHEVSERACWWYPHPEPGYEALAGAVAFYPERVSRATVDGEVVRSVAGDFYGGWVTSRVAGPFKGAPGTSWW